jgi:hypothetical protein
MFVSPILGGSGIDRENRPNSIVFLVFKNLTDTHLYSPRNNFATYVPLGLVLPLFNFNLYFNVGIV